MSTFCQSLEQQRQGACPEMEPPWLMVYLLNIATNLAFDRLWKQVPVQISTISNGLDV